MLIIVDLEWTDEEQAQLKTLVERYTSQGASAAWRVHRWWLACFSLVLGDTEDQNTVSGQWYDEWPLNSWVDSRNFRSQRVEFLAIFVHIPVEYPDPDEDEASHEVPLTEPESNMSYLPRAPSPQKAV